MAEQKKLAPEIDTHEIKRRSVVGAVTLTSRTFILQIIATIATFILTVLLDPATFGIFFVVTAVVNFLNYFSDIGLAAALIQKAEPPTQEDLATTFTIQQLLVGAAVIILLVFSAPIAHFYKLSASGLFLLRALTVSFFLSSLKTIPSVLLERKLDFKKLVWPQIVESLVFYITAIILAYRGYHEVSFAWAALIRGVSGTIVLYIIAPWKIELALVAKSAKKLLSFGLPYQANSFLALIKDDLLTLFLGKILPLTYVGYIGWAKKWAEIALRLIMDNIIKVTFPTYSRIQHDKVLLRKGIERSIFFMSLLVFPIAIGMMFMVRPFVAFIPRYTKWEPALLSFYLFTISSVLATLSSPAFNALNALGKVRYTFYLMIVWTGLTWLLIPAFVHLFGFNGVAIAAVIISITSFLPQLVIQKIVKVEFWKQIGRSILATVFMTMTLITVLYFIKAPALQLSIGIPLGMATYMLLVYVLLGRELTPYLKLFFDKGGKGHY